MAKFLSKDWWGGVGKGTKQIVQPVVKYGAPILGVATGGIAGGLIGTGASGLSSLWGAKNKSAALKRSVTYGLGVTAAGAVLGAVSGAGVGASGISSFRALTAPAAAAGAMDPALQGGGLGPTASFDPANAPASGGGFWGGLGGLFGGGAAAARGMGGAAGAGAQGYGVLGGVGAPEGTGLLGQGGLLGTGIGAGESEKPAGFPIVPVLIVAAIAYFALRKG